MTSRMAAAEGLAGAARYAEQQLIDAGYDGHASGLTPSLAAWAAANPPTEDDQ